MTEYVKKCQKHGDLTIDQAWKDGKYYRCKECKASLNKQQFIKHKEKRLKLALAYREQNREKLSEWARNDRKNNKERYQAYYHNGYGRGYSKRLHDLLKEYGITKEEYDLMFLKQDNKCKICKQPETRIDGKSGKVGRLSVDHCHNTGTVRGLLCNKCNSGIGFFRHNAELIKKAILYLRKHAA